MNRTSPFASNIRPVVGSAQARHTDTLRELPRAARGRQPLLPELRRTRQRRARGRVMNSTALALSDANVFFNAVKEHARCYDA